MGIWDKGFKEPDEQFPEEILKSYIDLFDKATGGFASLNLEKMSEVKKISSGLEGYNFQFKIVLTHLFHNNEQMLIMNIFLKPLKI
ncbi:MAG: hypothetical protein PF482_17530 [Desulfobacteraceae bacterium]|jgi:hypothetical protein|nr:hypothetical protein [Desulfobacteraceae bacterium]